jgi:transposase
MVTETVVEQVVQALSRGDGVSAIARAYGLDRKTVRAWRGRGHYLPRAGRPVISQLDPYRTWLAVRAPEVGYNASVLFRELREQGFRGSVIIVRRAVVPLRVAAAPPIATVRFETAPGEQAQVDFGQVRVWIADVAVAAQIFVMTLGYSRRCFAVAFPRQRVREWLAGHELAFQHFGGVTDTVVVDNAKAMVLAHTRGAITWHPTYTDFAGYYGFRPWACAPYRPQTKGKVESGVKYVARNALAGKRFHSWAHLNAWLVEWATTIADQRVHGTTHERPVDRFAREALTALDARPPYAFAHVRERIVPSDALVSIDGSRYSVPAHLAGTTVTVREHATDFTIWQRDTLVATHARQGRQQVVMVPAHYAGLLRVDRTPLAATPPQHDPRYVTHGDVAIRDLQVYERFAASASTEVAA